MHIIMTAPCLLSFVWAKESNKDKPTENDIQHVFGLFLDWAELLLSIQHWNAIADVLLLSL